MIASRLLLTEAAHSGDHIIPFDLDSAFLNAEIDRTVLVSLPEIWQDDKEKIVKLKKALHGLKEAPRAWFKKYGRGLVSLGWVECKSAPGLWRKPSKTRPGKFLKVSVYVDDNLITGPDKEEIANELNSIFGLFPGQIIDMKETVDEAGAKWLSLDFLGADVHYSSDARSMRVDMSTYIAKQMKRFNFNLTSPVYSPNYDEARVAKTEGVETYPDFPSRSVVGALQWVTTVARPDVTVPVNTLAKYVANTPTKSFTKAAKKIFKYLATTPQIGVSYSPDAENKFNKIYSELLPKNKPIPPINLFSDASFANCLKTMRSTSGSIIYYRGTPIAWKTQRQGVRAYSTAESEYIASSDTIALSETSDFLDFYRPIPSRVLEESFGLTPEGDDAILWVDNQSAITISKSDELKPKSRHYALRYLRVKDYAEKIVFCPTHLQKADALTKLTASVPQRELLLHHVQNPCLKVTKDSEALEDDVSSDEEIPSYADFKLSRPKKKRKTQ